MATEAKFVPPIPIFLAYLVPLEVDVVHQFLFGEFFLSSAKSLSNTFLGDC
jgi:hypothetical protein